MTSQTNAAKTNARASRRIMEYTSNEPLVRSIENGVIRTCAVQFHRYLAIARPYHYGKNILMIVEFALAGINRIDATRVCPETLAIIFVGEAQLPQAVNVGATNSQNGPPRHA
ncbi:MAG: hypothetical protein R3C59_28770 [Planctomycetaceae bacterium]